jgi:hypothetical protein
MVLNMARALFSLRTGKFSKGSGRMGRNTAKEN